MYKLKRLLIMMVLLLFAVSISVAQAKSQQAEMEDELVKLKSEKKDLYTRLGEEQYTNSKNKKTKKIYKTKKTKKKYRSRSRRVDIRVDISQQLMRVSKDNKVLYTWPVSTGRRGYETPRGNYRPKFIRRRHRSDACNRAFMPYAVFFDDNLAIYGVHSARKLGQNVAYSCIMIENQNARILYNLVKSYGKTRVKIKITR